MASELQAEMAGATAVDPSHFRGIVTPVGFRSPSGNITCGFYDDRPSEGGQASGVLCQIQQFDFHPPVDCHGDGSGGAIWMDSGGAPGFNGAGDGFRLAKEQYMLASHP